MAGQSLAVQLALADANSPGPDKVDDDTSSVSSSDSEVMYGQQLDENDWRWSVSSNAFFLVGGIGYVVMAIWDALRWDDEGFDGSGTAYPVFAVGTPLVYALNSAIDITWAQRIRERNRVKRQLRQQRLEQDGEEPTVEQSVMASPKKKKKRGKLQRFRKHAAHRRELMSAVCFVVASLAAVIDIFVGERTGMFFSLSVHAYVLSAVFAITGHRTRAWTCYLDPYNVDSLEDLGDIFFLVGSFVDLILCDFHFDDDCRYWPIFSSVLWLADACFYLRSDYLTIAHVMEPTFTQFPYAEMV